MPEPHLTFDRYLTPASDTFWRWSSGGGIVEWKDGTTIAFRDELATVLRPLAASGLPPFDMVVLVLAACRDSWKRFDAEVDLLVRGVEVLYRLRESGPLLHPIIQGLDRLHKLPPALREAPERKAELLAYLFEPYPLRMSRPDSTAIVDLLRGGVPEDMLGPAETTRTIRDWALELRHLLAALQRIDAERIRLWTQTGLEQPVLPAPLPDVDGNAAKTGKPQDLFDELERDPQLRGLAQLARHLKAVVALPRPIADRDELPLGGVSDISNRGPLDRLILSELAYDDDTLMVRVALNEALYLRRERPPDTPPRNRSLLLDSGLRMWGVPRVFATAVALALGAHPDRTTRVLRARGGALSAVDLSTRDGVVAHLGVLEPHAHPGNALAPFALSLGDEDHDVVVITGADVHADRDFRRQLDDCGLPRVLLALVSRTGAFRLIERSPRGEHTLLEAQLDVNHLLAPVAEPAAAPPAPVFDPKADRDLPAILRLQDFPLRLSHPVERSETFCVRNAQQEVRAFLSFTQDRRLMLWDRPACGSVQLSDDMPPGTLVAWNVPASSEQPIVCVVRGADWRRLFVIRILERSEDVGVVEIPSGKITQECRVWLHGGVVFHDVRHERRIRIFDCSTGRTLASAPYPDGCVNHTGRFFRCGEEWRALSWDGANACWELVLQTPHSASPRVIFDSPVMDGPVAVFPDGSLSLPGRKAIPIPHDLPLPVDVLASGRDGRQFQLVSITQSNGPPLHASCLVTLPELKIEVTHDPEWFTDSGFGRHRMLKPLRHQLTSIGVHNGELVLFAKGTPLVLRLDATRKRLQLVPDRAVRRPVTGEAAFGRPWKLPKRGYRLRRVVWPTGNIAIVDSRGLLHLRSSDANLPEFTLVLHDDDVAGWSSDGRLWGPPYFLGDAPASPPTAILETVIKPFLAQLP